MTADHAHERDAAGDGDSIGHSDHGRDGGHSTSARTLALVAGINLVGFGLELGGGLTFGSVALLSDAAHMLFDALAYLMAFAAASLAVSYTGSDRWSYGLHRLEPLSAFLNGVLLVPMVGVILWESYGRLTAPVAIDTGPTLVIAVFGLLVNLVAVFVLRGRRMGLNERGAFYHLLGDAGASVAVIVSTLGVRFLGLPVLDPLTAVVVSAFVLWSAWKLLAGSAAIFMQRGPVSVSAARERLASIDGVDAVEDVHTWQICSHLTIATTHLVCTPESVAEAATVVDRAHEVLSELGVDHATVELVTDSQDRLGAHDH